MEPEQILDFWFGELTPEDWFTKHKELDQKIRQRFSGMVEAASQGELASWRSTPRGRLAEILLLDQFPRNIYRDTPEAFAYDELALKRAEDLVNSGWDKELAIQERAFAYMPYMHSEDLSVHEKALELFSTPGLEENLKYEIAHKKILERFSRYPHRNKILGRNSTPEETEFLTGPGSSF